MIALAACSMSTAALRDEVTQDEVTGHAHFSPTIHPKVRRSSSHSVRICFSAGYRPSWPGKSSFTSFPPLSCRRIRSTDMPLRSQARAMASRRTQTFFGCSAAMRSQSASDSQTGSPLESPPTPKPAARPAE